MSETPLIILQKYHNTHSSSNSVVDAKSTTRIRILGYLVTEPRFCLSQNKRDEESRQNHVKRQASFTGRRHGEPLVLLT